MEQVSFLLNGDPVHLNDIPPTTTLLDWLRQHHNLCGTKEGCNEGDCGACTVMITDAAGSHVQNACILLIPQLHGKAVRTVEGISNGTTQHPVQQAMIDEHASQCGFCTPGFVVSLAVAHKQGATNFDTCLAGNLCRCTGYAPIIRAAQATVDQPVPEWMDEDLSQLGTLPPMGNRPTSTDELADWYLKNPDGILIAGATDVGLWVTKQLRDLGDVVFLDGIEELKTIRVDGDLIHVGAGTSISDFQQVIAKYHPDLGTMLNRFGSVQVRNAGTLGGNIANGSPIGDSPPALIALGARLHLRHGEQRRDMALEDFFVSYGKQDRKPGEFVEFITIPRQDDRLKCYKISKRFDQDISALLGCFSVQVSDGTVRDARIAFGGMAGTPKRASHVENALIDQPWTLATIHGAMNTFNNDFSPLSDMRASADYRQEVAQNLLLRYFQEDQGQPSQVREVAP